MISVLYVDDEPGLLRLGKTFLEHKGQFQVDTITSVSEALPLLDSRKYDAIISDYQMPDRDGIDFLRTVRSAGNNIPFILFTGRGREEVVIEAINNGADFYLQKGGNPTAQFTELAHKIQQAVKGRMAEESLRESENMYRTIFTTTGAATIIVEKDTKIVLANEGFARLSGYSVEELEGKRSWTEFIVPEDLERMKKYHHDRRNDPVSAPRVYEFRFIDRNGRVKYCINNVAVIPGTTRSVASVVDITDRVLAEQDYRSIVENMQDVFYRTDPAGNIIRVSPSALAILGYDSVSDLYGKSVAEALYVYPEDRKLFLADLEKSGGAVTNYEILLKKKDGTPVYALSSSHKYYDAAGNFGGVEGILRDITDRKQAEKDLRDRERRAGLQRTAIAGFVIDPVFAGGEINRALQHVVKMLADTLGVARASVWTLEEDGSELLCRSLYEADKKVHSSGATLKAADYPHYFEAFMSENRINANDAQNDPRTSEMAESYLMVLGITSMLDAGVFIEGRLVGVVCSEHIGARRSWYPDEESFISTTAAIIAQLFLNAERKKTEEALSASEERLHLALEGGELGTWNWNVQTGEVIFNQRWADLLGYRLEEIEPHVLSWEKLLHPDDKAHVQEILAAHLEGKTSQYECEHRLRHKDGSWVWVLDKGRVISRDPEGKPLLAAGTHLDITERKRAEEALRESEGHFRTLANAALEGIMIHDRGVIIECNPQFAALFGYKPEEIIGRKGFDFMITRESQEAISHWIRDGAKGTIDITGIRKDGKQFHGETASTPLLWHGKEHTIVQMHDISARKENERLLQSQKAELNAAYEQIAASEKELKANLEELKRQERIIRDSEARLRYMLGYYDLAGQPERDLMAYAVEGAGAVTASPLGYLAFLNRDETELSMYAWSKTAMEECSMREKPIVYPVEKTGLWGEAVRKRSPVITNDYAAPNPEKKGYPDGHPQIIRHMNVPILDGDHIVIVAGVANKSSDYTDHDVHQLTLLMQGLWQVLKRRRTEEELQAAYEQITASEEKLRGQYETLALSEELYRKLVSTVPDIVVRTDLAGNIVFINETGITMSGYATARDVLGKSVFMFFSPEDLPRAIENTKLMFTRQLGPVEYTFVSQDGKRFSLEINGDVLRTPDGEPFGMVYVGRDITSRKKAFDQFGHEI